MIMSGERDDVFYDSVEFMSTFDEELGGVFWRNELKSVKERREAFLRVMGSVDLDDSSIEVCCVAECVGMSSEKLAECSGTVSSSSFGLSVGNGTVEIQSHCEREEDGEANVMVDETESEVSFGSSPAYEDASTSALFNTKVDDQGEISSDKKGALNWWKKVANKRRVLSTFLNMATKAASKVQVKNKVKVQVKKKSSKELSALYIGQEFQAHEGIVRTAKFSPDGQYLATGGQDGVLRVWLVASGDAHEKPFGDHPDCHYGTKGGKAGVTANKMAHVPVVIPDRVFQIQELPLHDFRGHCGDILDLSWSNSNLIISSSSDNTVRLWQIGSDECLSVYRHSNFVTCVQFNPIDDGYFISGSVDGKIRLWTVSEGRVVDWDDTRDAVTAISYQPDGQGLVVGCLNGSCRFYDASVCSLQLITHAQLLRNKKSSGNRISGIQFCQDDSQRVIITSEDSKVRIFDKTELIQKYRGLPKSGAQMSASVTANGRHIISVGEDSHIYLWEYDQQNDQQQKTAEKRPKSIRSCEYFPLQGVSAVAPWYGYAASNEVSGPTTSGCTMRCCSQGRSHQEPARVSISNWLSPEGSLRVTATWPEEMLPFPEEVSYHYQDPDEQESRGGCHFAGACSPTWGLVVVAATCDGIITVLHNYGLFQTKV